MVLGSLDLTFLALRQHGMFRYVGLSYCLVMYVRKVFRYVRGAPQTIGGAAELFAMWGVTFLSFIMNPHIPVFG